MQVRDQLTTAHEQELLRRGEKTSPTLSRDAVLVDAVVNTGKCSGSADECGMYVACRGLLFGRQLASHRCSSPATKSGVVLTPPALHVSAVGFPLVGGPAGTMEGGRQSEIAKAILSTKNVPYVVAAPLLIQARRGGNVRGLGALLAGALRLSCCCPLVRNMCSMLPCPAEQTHLLARRVAAAPRFLPHLFSGHGQLGAGRHWRPTERGALLPARAGWGHRHR